MPRAGQSHRRLVSGLQVAASASLRHGHVVWTEVRSAASRKRDPFTVIAFSEFQSLFRRSLSKTSTRLAHSLDVTSTCCGSQDWLDRSDIQVGSSTYAELLQYCGSLKALSQGKHVHDDLIKSGLDRNVVLQALLVHMYNKCGARNNALNLFNNLHQRNAFLWNAMTTEYVREGPIALRFFDQMFAEGVPPDRVTFVCILSACACLTGLVEGKRVHARIVGSDFVSDLTVSNALLNMYSKCRSLEDVWTEFDRMAERNVISWTVVIAILAQHGWVEDALRIFDQMQGERIVPDKVAFLSILSACANQSYLTDGKQIHANILESGVTLDVVLGTALLNMYGSCGSLDDALRIFNLMCDRNVLSWNSMIAAYAESDFGNEALSLFNQMLQEGILPDNVTLIHSLSSCSSQTSLIDGKRIHAQVQECGFELDVVVGTALVNMYGKCSDHKNALKMFDQIPKRNVVSWNSIISVYAEAELGREALLLFDRMQQEGVMPDEVTFINCLSACASHAALFEGRQMHVRSLDGESKLGIVTGTALINMYGKCSSLEEACEVFDEMPTLSLISWNAMIGGYAHNGNLEEVLKLFHQMQQKGVTPDKVTFVCIFNACASQAALAKGEHIHSCILDMGIELDVVLGTALINMYCKCGSLEAARELFDKMPHRNVISWNAMISGYAQHGRGRDAVLLFDHMYWEGFLPNKVTYVSMLDAYTCESAINEGKHMHTHIIHNGFEPESVIGNALVTMYGNCGSMVDALTMFERIPKRDVVSWTAMICVYVNYGKSEEAALLFNQMQLEGLVPSKATLLRILEAWIDHAELAKGGWFHAYITHNGLESDVVVATALVNMYGKCGSLQLAQNVFDKTPRKDMVLWNTMIAVHSHHGHVDQVVRLFEQLRAEGVVPNRVTFISILAAFSHAGLVNEGCYVFDSMMQDHGIFPSVDHYDCMIDLLGRAGLLDEAEEMIRMMPFQPSVVSFMTLLSACRCQVDVNRGKRAAKGVFDLDPGVSAPYVMLSNIYAADGCI